MNRVFFLNHAPIYFYFKQSSDDFVVDEVPLYEFSGSGEHLIINIRKKNITTDELIKKISKEINLHPKFIGYAGLKDKKSLSRQYISIPRKYEEFCSRIEDERVKILSKTYHNNKIRIGHLKGNRFFIRIKKLNPVDAKKLSRALKEISKEGIPNYFGYQRFGNDGDNFELGKKIASGELNLKDRKKSTFLLSSYQSYLFNNWLQKRVEMSKILDEFEPKESSLALNIELELAEKLKKQSAFFKVFEGDLMQHYPFGKIFYAEDLDVESERFFRKEISPTGLLCGKRVKISKNFAYELEKEYIDEIINESGSRRYAWIFPEDITFEYKEENFWGEISFFLPKGAYATVLLEEATKTILSPQI